jgi:hypothetical protein
MCISKRGLSRVFGVPGPSSKLAGFQCRPPSYISIYIYPFVWQNGLFVLGALGASAWVSMLQAP